MCGAYTGEHDYMSTVVSLTNHLHTLEKKHRELDERIIILEDEHTTNEIINPLKVEKLALKREIEELKKKIEVMQNEGK